MSSENNPFPSQPQPNSPGPTPSRQEFVPLRAATLILPRTGERVKRTFTLRDAPTPSQSRLAQLQREANNEAQGIGPESPLLATHIKKKRQARENQQWWLQKSEDVRYTISKWSKDAYHFVTSSAGQGVLKCSIAYLLGSCGTFVPFISEWLGDQDGKHMVATVTVYFHASRSQGNMFEAALMAVIAFLYAAFISFASMGVEIYFDQKLNKMILGHAVVVIVFCGGGLGFVGWAKQKLANPLVNVACSLTSLAIITVLTKEETIREAEFSVDKVTQVMKMVLLGIVFSTLVNFLILPVSARKGFRQNLLDVTDSLSDMLAMITRGFLTGSEKELEQRGFEEASTKLKSQYASLSKNLKEGKWEHYVLGTESQYKIEVKLLNCMRRLQQNLGGLRSAAMTQFSLLEQSQALGGATPADQSIFTPTTAGLSTNFRRIDSWMSFQENFATLEAADNNEHSTTSSSQILDADDQAGLPTARSSSEIFERFIMHLGPSLKSLAYTLTQILDDLPYGGPPKFEIAINPKFRSSLIDAIDLYSEARKRALKHLYRGKALSMNRPQGLEADFEEVAASCGYFSFSLLDFAEEMKAYLDILDELKDEIDKPWKQRRSWRWLKVWNSFQSKKHEDDDPESNTLISHNGEEELQREHLSPTYNVPEAMLKFPKKSTNTGWRYKLWRLSRVFRQDDTKFAIKVGAGAALFALPSFIDETQPFYEQWRGEWGLLSYMLVCSMTIGASNTTGWARAWGTCFGALCAVLAWILSGGNVFLMAFFGWAMALLGFYIIVGQGKGPLGRFIMLSYNLTALYAYSLSVKDDETWDEDEEGTDNSPRIWNIALHRVVAVLTGVLWALIVTQLIWPISARRKFRDGLSLLLLRMSLVWKRDPLTTLQHDESQNTYMNLREELQLQRYLARLEILKTSSSYEYEMRGPFPSQAYTKILKSVGRMLDAFHAMNVVITTDLTEGASRTQLELLRYTVNERAQLCARIAHLFQVMASSLKLEFPLNDALPNTDHARDRLLAKIFKFRKTHTDDNTSDEDFAVLYAYALVTGQLSKEIQDVYWVIEDLFGVLDEDLLKLN
ncbi:MAG: hypothetical protein GOMPHAMPRED_001524 [Gomphillus americanus]|uniref:DUF2421 domain-containing protein n=1 Tax=Gomphillus americanus TaxID=1940652 RepID=A0A8H3IH32_9LECA|nr:MAG: hypothetical protein GOMPHAMPRED_001524 [Gomphillus americanus]